MTNEKPTAEIVSLPASWNVVLSSENLYEINHLKINHSTKLLLISLQVWFRSNEECWPSYETISDFIGLSVRQTKRLIGELVENGLIEKIEKPGRSNTNILKKTCHARHLLDGENMTSTTPFNEEKGDIQGNKRCHAGSKKVTRMSPRNIRKNKEERRSNPPYPPGGGNALKIVSGKMPRNPIEWEPWNEIKKRIKESIPEEDYEPLLGDPISAIGKQQGEIIVRGYYIRSPECLSETLRLALTNELTKRGITTLRIAGK